MDDASERLERLRRLTPMQRAVLRLWGTGLSIPAIAQTLFISETRVKQHITEILKRLEIRALPQEDRTQERIRYAELIARVPDAWFEDRPSLVPMVIENAPDSEKRGEI